MAEERPPVVDDELDKLYYADEPEDPPLPRKKVPAGDVYEAARAGDVDRLRLLLDGGVNVNDRDAWDSVALYYACLAGHLDAAQMLLEKGAICSEHTFDGDRCHYAALNLKVRRLLKTYEARPPPLAPLQDALRVLFFRSGENSRYVDPTLGVPEAGNGDECGGLGDLIGPDIVFYVQGNPISAHGAILAARSPFFRRKFENEWRGRKEVRFARNRLSFPALFSLISFFYCDRLDVAVDDMEDLLRICKVCGCPGLQKIIEKELVHQKFAEYKALRDIDDSQKRFILQSSSLPEDERLPAAMHRLLRLCLANSGYGNFGSNSHENRLSQQMQERLKLGNEACTSSRVEASEEDHADMCFSVEGRRFRCHRVVLAARSDYIRARISRTNCFREGMTTGEHDNFHVLEEHDLSADVFQKLLEYIYTDAVEGIDSDQAEEMLDAASRYLLFPLKRVVADALLPQLENASEAELCRWLLVADMYGVWKLKEHCLDSMAANFEIFAATPEFSHMLRKLPPPSGDSSTRTTAPSAPGGVREDQGNLLDDLREKWLEAEGAELDHRDESAKQFDRRLELLIETAEDE